MVDIADLANTNTLPDAAVVVIGTDGTDGAQGLYDVEVYRTVTTGTTLAAPTGGTINPVTGIVTSAPASWLTSIPTVQATETLFISRLTINPATDTASFSGGSRWSTPFEAGGTGPAGPQGPGGQLVQLALTLPFPAHAARLVRWVTLAMMAQRGNGSDGQPREDKARPVPKAPQAQKAQQGRTVLAAEPAAALAPR